jgi:hypothetical protein
LSCGFCGQIPANGNNILAESAAGEDDGDDDPSWWDDEALLMAVDIGYDESGSVDTLLVTAQVGVVSKARKMKTAWRTLLREAGVPYFHSVDYDNFDDGVFKGLTREERHSLLCSLSGHVRKRMLFGITGKLTVSRYDSQTTNEFRSQWGTAYSFAIQMLMLIIHLRLEEHRLGREANVLVEGGHRHSNQVLQILEKIRKAAKIRPADIPVHILSLGLGSKADHPILQTADMLAYSEWQRLQKGDREIYDSLHVKTSRYGVGYVDLDVNLMDVALQIAKQSDEAKAIVKKAWFYQHSPNTTQEEVDETVKAIREFRQKYAELDERSTQRDQKSSGSGKGTEGTEAEG